MLALTDTAATKFREMAAGTANPESQMLRISYAGYGWGGPQLGLALEELQRDDDLVVETNGVRVIYHKDLDNHIYNLTLDYGDRWYNKGFRFTGKGTGVCG